jgi:hypothetical protein
MSGYGLPDSVAARHEVPAARLLLVGFLAGAAAVLVFHQGLQFLLFHHFGVLRDLGLSYGLRPTTPGYSLYPVAPFGLPQVASLAFWGGIWGTWLAWLIARDGMPALLSGVVTGAVLCTLVGFTLVPWLRDAPMWGGGNMLLWARTMMLNAAWGWGCAAILRAAGLGRPLADPAYVQPQGVYVAGWRAV